MTGLLPNGGISKQADYVENDEEGDDVQLAHG
jgi:hypothetical protein